LQVWKGRLSRPLLSEINILQENPYLKISLKRDNFLAVSRAFEHLFSGRIVESVGLAIAGSNKYGQTTDTAFFDSFTGISSEFNNRRGRSEFYC
jgi:hypothetical protein